MIEHTNPFKKGSGVNHPFKKDGEIEVGSALNLYHSEDAHKVLGQEVHEDTNEPLLSQEYDGEYRHFMKLPSTLKKMLEVETDAGERKAIEAAIAHWESKKGDGSTSAGEPYRGECRASKQVDSLQESIGTNGKVEHVYQGTLSIPESQKEDGEGIIDFDELGGLSVGEGGIKMKQQSFDEFKQSLRKDKI